MNKGEIVCFNEIITTDEKTLTVYFMLKNKNRVDYETFYEMFGASKRTFHRVISTLRKSLDQSSMNKTHIIYNTNTLSYELVEFH